MRIETRQLTGYVVCLASFFVIAWSFYPGVMTADSIAALEQGRANVYGDVNAPLMSWLWGRLDSLLPGPALIFVIHLAIFWIAAALFWRSTRQRSFVLAAALVLFGLAPHVLAQTVVVWKDVALGVSLFMSTALLYLAKREQAKWALLASIVFLFYGYAARLNALPAVLPIAIWTGSIAAEIFDIGKRKRLLAAGIGVSYFVILSATVYFLNDRLTAGRSDFPSQQIYLYDLAGIAAGGNEVEFPAYIRNDADFSVDLIRSRYNERSVSDLIFPNIPNAGDRPPFKWTRDADDLGDLRNAWADAVAANPATYIRHRSSVFAQLIGLRRSVTAPYVAEGFASNPPEFRGGDNPGYAVLMKYFGAFRRPFPQTFFFRAVIWIAICLVLVAVAIRRGIRRDWDLVLVMASSSLLFIAAYFPTTPSTEFRYLFWPAIASAFATIFGIYLLRSERRSSSAVG